MSTPFPLLKPLREAAPDETAALDRAIKAPAVSLHQPSTPNPQPSLTDEQLTAATLAAASSIRARLNAIGTHTPSWFAEECAAVITREIRKAEAQAARHASPFTVVTPAPGTPENDNALTILAGAIQSTNAA